MIKKYIQFGIENGYKFKYNLNRGQRLQYMPDGIEEGKIYVGNINISYNRVNNFKIEFIEKKIMYAEYYNLLEIITSNEFITAIAKGKIKNIDEGRVKLNEKYFLKQEKDEITKYQAIAIRDGKLEEYIKDLFNNL